MISLGVGLPALRVAAGCRAWPRPRPRRSPSSGRTRSPTPTSRASASCAAALGAIGQQQGYAADADEILVTTGARQGIDLVARAIARPDDVVCVESPTYVGILSSFEATGARVLGIPTDADGLDVDALERVLQRYPVKLVALQPACQNPTGTPPRARTPRAAARAGARAVVLRARGRRLRAAHLRRRRRRRRCADRRPAT